MHGRLFALIIGGLLTATPGAGAAAMTVEQAYAAIPHRRPTFDFSAATLPEDESVYLKQLFRVMDLAVKERVETLQWLHSAGASGNGTDGYDALLKQLSTLHVPGRLELIHRWVTEAIQEQRDVLRQWREHPGAVSLAHPLVHSASRKLSQAYGLAIQLYARERPQNLEAFYDYFCSLDFL